MPTAELSPTCITTRVERCELLVRDKRLDMSSGAPAFTFSSSVGSKPGSTGGFSSSSAEDGRVKGGGKVGVMENAASRADTQCLGSKGFRGVFGYDGCGKWFNKRVCLFLN